MTKVESINKEQFIQDYERLNSSHKVGDLYSISSTYAQILLKKWNCLKSKNEAASIRNKNNPTIGRYKRTEQHKKALSLHASSRIGELNPFYGKVHREDSIEKMREARKLQVGKRNPNYKHGNYKRRTRDFMLNDIKSLTKQVFERDNYTCRLTGTKGGNLVAHHLIPFWVCQEAFLDLQNLITVTKEAHFRLAHRNSWESFNVEIIPQFLLDRYSLDRERLNEMAAHSKSRCDSPNSRNI